METTGNASIRDSEKRDHKSVASQGNMPWKFFTVLILITIPFWIFGGDRLPIPIKLPASALAAFNPFIAALIVTYRASHK
jgi:hypothetical protein